MRRLLFLAVCVAACERRQLTGITAELDVSPRELGFGDVFVGFPATRTIALTNRSSVDQRLVVSVAPPFEAQGELVVPGGASSALAVRFAPTAAGPVSAALTIAELAVTLTGNGVPPPSCSTAEQCRASSFDPALGACVETDAPNGTACTNACISSGACSAGKCVGSALSCDDADRCTVDACDLQRGCAHVPMECAAPASPCKVARCDPSAGCVESDARDGTACGPADCMSARVCIVGECKTVSVPEGAKCTEPSPCQSAGTCTLGACVSATPAALAETWGYTLPTQHRFEGVSDRNQNLYWFECGAICAAVSYTRDGFFRFRTPITTPGVPERHLIVGDQLIWAGLDQVGAISTLDGVELWTHTLNPNPPGAPDVAATIRVWELAAAGPVVMVHGHREAPPSTRQCSLLRLTASGGLSMRWAPEHLGAVFDEQGNFYFAEQPLTLVSLDPAGVERWRVPTSAHPIAAFGGDLLLELGELRSTVDGAMRAPRFGTFLNNPLMLPSARVLLSEDWPAQRLNADAFKPASAMPAWQALVTPLHGTNHTSNVIATSTGGFLVGAGDSRHPTYLKAFSAAGAERWACELDTTTPGGGAWLTPHAALLDERWVTVTFLNGGSQWRLSVFSVPGERPALQGWVGPRGGPAGANRPR